MCTHFLGWNNSKIYRSVILVQNISETKKHPRIWRLFWIAWRVYISLALQSITVYQVATPERSLRIFHPSLARVLGVLFKESDFRLTYFPGIMVRLRRRPRRATTSFEISTNGERGFVDPPIDLSYVSREIFLKYTYYHLLSSRVQKTYWTIYYGTLCHVEIATPEYGTMLGNDFTFGYIKIEISTEKRWIYYRNLMNYCRR